MKKVKWMLFVGFMMLLYSCGNENKPEKNLTEYQKQIENWHSKRINSLKKNNGWLNLVGLYWLDEGVNTFGSGKNNNIVFPENAPEYLGKFIKKDSIIIFESNERVNVFYKSKVVKKIKMRNDLSDEPTVLENGSLRWFIIKRGEKYGIRLRDINAKLVKEFEGIDMFPIDEKWKITAKFIPYKEPKEISVPTVIGTIDKEKSPGQLIFDVEGEEYSLEPTDEGNKFFIVFADLTSGEETYGAGRFLYVDKPDSNNNVILDFNKAYNPPCAFTKYATCPLPIDENKLHVKITAGEKNYGYNH